MNFGRTVSCRRRRAAAMSLQYPNHTGRPETHHGVVLISKDGMPQKGIRRVDCKATRTHGWYATVRRKSGELTRVFSDGRYGGRRVSYRAAVAWIAEQWKRCPTMPRAKRMSLLRRNNRTGISGVYRWPADGRDITGAYWAVQWVPVPKQPPVRRKFSVSHHGEQAAKRLAAKVRRAAVSAIAIGREM